MEKEKKGSNFGKTLLISAIILAVVVLYVVIGSVLHIGTDLLFLGVIIWAKCFHLSLKPVDVLQCWSGAAVGVGIWFAEHLVGQSAGATAGTIVLLVLVFIQIIFDVGSISKWIVNPSTPLFLTVTLVLANFTPAADILKGYCLSFLGVAVPILIIGKILSSRK